MQLLRHSRRDLVLVALSLLHGALLLGAPSAPLIAIGLWWNANTVSHNFIHLPFFRARSANLIYSLYLSLLLGLPQTLWRDRHLAHHAGRPWKLHWSGRFIAELVTVTVLWVLIASMGPRFFLGTWLVGWLGGLLLCTLQGHYEHVRGTVSHYGRLYNFAFFNDGYHVEHHARPGLHWSRLPAQAEPGAEQSAWPAALRWLEPLRWSQRFHTADGLEVLERMVLRSRLLQRFVLERHSRAFADLLRLLPPVQRIAIVGGGLFPRTALVLLKLLPNAELTIIDQSEANLLRARTRLNGRARWIQARYSDELCSDADLLIIPLSFRGDRNAFYSNNAARAVIVHEWIWRPRAETRIVSTLLLKRLNLARPAHTRL